MDAASLVHDILDLHSLGRNLDAADSGFFHTLPDDGHPQHVRGLGAFLRTEGGSSLLPSASSSRPDAPGGGRRPATFESRVGPEGLRTWLSKVVRLRRRHRDDDGRLAPDRARTFLLPRACVRW